MRLTTKPLSKLTGSALFALWILGTSQMCWGAACCGGGFAAPSLIVGDDQAQMTNSYTYSQVADDVGTDSLWRKRNSKETNEIYKIEAAHIFYDQWQAGFSIPVVRRTRAEETSTGLGDVAATLGYEYLPDWDYNPWRPRGLGYFQLTLPTGKSVNESEADFQLDSRGRGFWAIGIGTILTKIFGKWDVYSNIDLHRSFDKQYTNSQSEGTLKPGYGENLGIGGGYNLAHLRIGSSLTWSHEDPVDVEGTLSSIGAPQELVTATFSISYLLQNEWATTFTYTDQTLFGEPQNTSLNQGATVFLQKRWLR